ncbi:MAG: thiamine-phosphate kinase [Rikenellaceae bacterium]
MNIAELGEFAFIDRLCEPFEVKNADFTAKGCGDDAAVIEAGDKYILTSVDMFMEGVHFDLVYTPFKHLGFKCVVAAGSDILAMNGTVKQIMVAIALSSRFTVEQIDEFYEGVKSACDKYGIDLVGGDTTASLTGLAITMTVVGEVAKDKIVYRSGAKNSDLICVTSDLGAAYLGTRLLDREKRVLKGNDVAKPKFDGYEYPLERALKPLLRKDVIELLGESNIVPTSMIDLSDGLASDLKHICKSSKCGAKIFLERIPINSKCFDLAEELNEDPVVAVMNGGDDYELMFTVGVDKYEQVARLGGINIIGHIIENGHEVLVTPEGGEIAIKAQGWK